MDSFLTTRQVTEVTAMRGEYWDYSLDLPMPSLCRIPRLAAANRGPEIEDGTSIIKSSMF